MTCEKPLPSMLLTCFKAYDIRARLGADLNPAIAYRIGRAFAETLGTRRVVVGRDCRASSADLSGAVIEGLLAAGVEVLDLGLCGTEEMYFATTHFEACGGIEVTASHNPVDWNGLKMVKTGSAPLDPEADMAPIRALAESGAFAALRARGVVTPASGARDVYVNRVLSLVNTSAIRPMAVLVNAGNGAAGPTFDAIAAELDRRGVPLRFVKMHHDPDASFPNGIPNPLLPENQPVTARAVVEAEADFGVAWDGDFDRCFLFDRDGRFVPGEYIVGLLSQVFLVKEPGATIIHDPRIVWNTQSIVEAAGGKAQASRTGHAFLKQALRQTGAVYGGEMSAHHYFRDFMACDSGMIPWLLVAELMGRTGRPLADLIAPMRVAFPSSGEINFTITDTATAMSRVEDALAPCAVAVDRLDGLTLIFDDWRFNLRSSNTEPLLRLNVEIRGENSALDSRVAEVAALIGGQRVSGS